MPQTMDEGARRWMYKTAREHHWRVASYIDLDDLIQDGFLEWHRIVTRYSHIESKAHIMALFKRVFHMRLNDLSNQRTRSVREVLHSDLAMPGANEDQTWEQLLAVYDTDFLFYVEAPKAVRELLKALASDTGIETLRALPRVRPDGTIRTLNEKFCALVGCDPLKDDLVLMLRRYLRGTGRYYRVHQ